MSSAIKTSSWVSGWLSRGNVFRLYVAIQTLGLLAAYSEPTAQALRSGSLLSLESMTLLSPVLFMGVLCLGMVLLYRWAAVAHSALYLAGFLIIQWLPRWDMNPAIPTWHIRCVALMFLVPAIFTITCWKALR